MFFSVELHGLNML